MGKAIIDEEIEMDGMQGGRLGVFCMSQQDGGLLHNRDDAVLVIGPCVACKPLQLLLVEFYNYQRQARIQIVVVVLLLPCCCFVRVSKGE